jgi:glutaredoxin 3
VVFGRDTCPFCTELERTLNDRAPAKAAESNGNSEAAGWAYYRLNRIEYGKELHEQLKKGTGQTSVPYLFVDGKLVGGCDDLMRAEYTGGLPGTLEQGPAAADVAAPDWCVRSPQEQA